MTRAERWLDGLVVVLARHWLGVLLAGLGIFVTLPIAAPVLAYNGHDRAAGAIYFAYRITCHQLPHHSWFLFGPKQAYSWPEVQPYTGVDLDTPLRAYHSPLGDPALGYQIAFCQRDVAIWWSLLLTTMVLAVLIRRRARPPLPLRHYAIALIPIGVDGVTQLVGWRTSTPLLRTVTGALFGAATALLVIPYLDLGFRDVLALSEQARARRQSSENEATPR